LAICKAMVQTGIYPDFITVDGGEGGTGAAPLEFSNSVGMPLREALAFVYDALTGFDLKKYIKLIASGKVATGFDLVKNFALRCRYVQQRPRNDVCPWLYPGAGM
jgi:glutamate synthase domain-containing protein 2